MQNSSARFFRIKIYSALLLLTLVLLFGILGFIMVSGYSWIDSLYIPVITITTVGFGEIELLDNASKTLTIFLILFRVIIVGYALTVITEYILNRNNLEELKQKKHKRIDSLKHHIIICSYDRNGKPAEKKLLNYKNPFVINEEYLTERCRLFWEMQMMKRSF